MGQKILARHQRGGVAILTALLVPVFLGFAALAIDIAYFHVVRNELRNDADAAALAGARYLYSGGGHAPNWAMASQQAVLAVALNRAAGQPLSQATVRVGYWNLLNNPGHLQPLPMTPTANDVPAVEVTVARAVGYNGGPVQTFFARIWGRDFQPLSATAMAGPTSPDSMGAGAAFPFVMPQCMFDTYWNASTYPPGPRNDPSTGRPYVFQLGSTYHYSTCTSGNWTSFLLNTNNVPTIRTLIANGNPSPLQIGQNIWVQPGTRTTLFQTVAACSAAGTRACEYVALPVVQNVETHRLAPIRAFACLRILNAIPNQQYIQAEMSTQCPPASSSGLGLGYGIVSPPSLFR